MNRVLSIEVLVARCFADMWPTKRIPAKAGHDYIRSVLKGTGIHKKDIGAARKNLKVQSLNVDGEHWWIWENEKEPAEVWVEKNREYWSEQPC